MQLYSLLFTYLRRVGYIRDIKLSVFDIPDTICHLLVELFNYTPYGASELQMGAREQIQMMS